MDFLLKERWGWMLQSLGHARYAVDTMLWQQIVVAGQQIWAHLPS
jgi:hypothetical protein